MEMPRNIMPCKEIPNLNRHTTLFFETLSLISGHVFQKRANRRNARRFPADAAKHFAVMACKCWWGWRLRTRSSAIQESMGEPAPRSRKLP